jgi:hypothetical protein
MRGATEKTLRVMAGLVPAIHAFACCPQDVDARHKAGHDGLRVVRQLTGDRP